jgi:3-isopropylmalate dehydrogenase
VHGSAPDIAGQDKANPIGAVASAAMLLRHALNLEQEAAAVDAAIEKTLIAGIGTADLAPVRVLGTRGMASEIVSRL